MPTFKFNLLSIGRLSSARRLFTKIFPYECIFLNLTIEKVVAIAPFDGGLYRLKSLSHVDTVEIYHPSTQSSQLALIASTNIAYTPISCAILLTRLQHTSLSKMKHFTL